jgi:uncharacterized membrane protein YdbT with pleckstrin-like domain
VPFPKRLLTDGEEIVLDLRPHWIALAGPVLATFAIVAIAGAGGYGVGQTSLGASSWVWYALGGAALLAWLVLALPGVLRWMTTQFALTNERLISRSGVVAKRSKEIPLEAVNDVTFTQTLFDRMVGAGNLVVESAGERGQETFARIAKPEDVQKSIYAASERRKGLHGPPASVSVADEIAKLATLRDQGALTPEEFEARKHKLLEA